MNQSTRPSVQHAAWVLNAANFTSMIFSFFFSWVFLLPVAGAGFFGGISLKANQYKIEETLTPYVQFRMFTGKRRLTKLAAAMHCGRSGRAWCERTWHNRAIYRPLLELLSLFSVICRALLLTTGNPDKRQFFILYWNEDLISLPADPVVFFFVLFCKKCCLFLFGNDTFHCY